MHQCALQPCVCMTLLRCAGYMSMAVKAMQLLFKRLLILAVLHELGLALNEFTLAGAVASEREDIVGFLHTQHKCPLAWYIGFAPARSGNVSMLRYLRQRGYEFDHFGMCSDAARGGHLEALRYLHSEGCAWFSPSIAGEAAGSGNIEMVSTSYAAFKPSPNHL